MKNEKKPQVLSLKEIDEYLDVIVERKRFYGETIVYAATLAGLQITDESEFVVFIVGPTLPIYEYGSWWRCWDKRPTDDQRMEVPWNVHNV